MFDETHYQMLDRKINPKERASIFSIITFYFTLPLIKRGYLNELQEKDIYKVHSNHDSERTGNALQTEWDEEKGRESPSLFNALRRNFMREIVIYALIQIILKTPITILRAVALQKILEIYKATATDFDRQSACYYGSFFALSIIILCVYTHTYMLCMQEVSLKIRVALCSLIYRKCLRLKSATIKEFTVGNIITLITKDVREFENFVVALQEVVVGVINVLVFVLMMYYNVGVSALYGAVILISILPVQLLLSRATTLWRLKTAAKTDSRLRIIEDVLSSIRIIKMYTWENYFIKNVNKLRRMEIFNLRIVFYLKSTIGYLGTIAVRVGLFVTIFFYTRSSAEVNAANLYFILSCMQIIRMITTVDIPRMFETTAEIRSSLKRLQRLLTSDESEDVINETAKVDEPSIQIDATVAVRGNPEFLRANLKLEKGLIALSGPLGSGTTLFIKTLLGDLPYDGKINVNGTVSYAAQEPWLFPGTIRQNIVFGREFNRGRYDNILRICALEKDLNNFPKRDETVINDDGICLSSGQQVRINLARALYKEADIYLLDFCLASLDTNIKNHVFENCMNNFLKGKLCVFSTNRDEYLRRADVILTIRNGKVEVVDNHESIKDIPLDVQDDLDETYSGIIYESGFVEPDENTKLVDKEQLNKKEDLYHEKSKSGKVTFSVYREYLRSTGYVYLALLFLLYAGWMVLSIKFEKFVRNWTNIEDKFATMGHNVTNQTIFDNTLNQRNKIPKVFIMLMVGITVLFTLKVYVFYYLIAKASKKIHKLTFTNVIFAPISFFDEHLVGNVMNRFSKDVAATDEYFPIILDALIDRVFLSAGALFLIGSHSYKLLVISITAIVLLFIIRSLYIPSCRTLKRLEAATRSPVVGFARTTLEGTNTIRGSGLTRHLTKEFDRVQNLHTSADYMYIIANRSLFFYTEFVASIYLAVVVYLCIFVLKDSRIGDIGLTLTQAYALTKHIHTVIRCLAEIENQMTSLERILEYRDIERESTSGTDLHDWLNAGKIEYTNVSLRYPKTNQLVLKNVSLRISPKERVCIIGRTGAGKTSLLSTLFRLYETETGNVYLDDTEISKVNLRSLRSGLSVIPQNPTLFVGTLRTNLDPNDEYKDDKKLWDALKEVHFETLCSDRITLDTPVNDGGVSFSAGQKQLICLARALIKKNKILILDEATSYLDNDTADAIDRLIRTKFSECTVITILHKLKTVRNYDKVMIVSDGRVVEFDTPTNLLNNQNSRFYNIMSKEK